MIDLLWAQESCSEGGMKNTRGKPFLYELCLWFSNIFATRKGRCSDCMSGRKQTPGMSFWIIKQDAYQAVLEYTYYCPYCMRKSTSQSVVFPVDYERLESGGFYDTLTCSQCSKKADVRFWQTMKKTTKEKEP